MVFDPLPSRAVTLFGRPVDSSVDFGLLKPDYTELRDNPDPAALSAAGYDYIYLTGGYWWAHRRLLDVPCALTLDEEIDIYQATGETGDFRRLVDLSACR
jgi:hypothetical protein